MIVAFRIMPEDGEVEYSELESSVNELVSNYHESVEIKSLNAEGVGFGLQAVAVEIQIDENCGTEELETKLSELSLSGEVTITKMDRL